MPPHTHSLGCRGTCLTLPLTLLQGHVASIDVEGRTKSVHSTWRKMQRRELSSIASVHDLLALRIVVHPRYTCE